MIRCRSCLFAALLLLPASASAQFEHGEILGAVRDSSGAVVADARITVRNLDTNLQYNAATDAQGNYSLPSLRIGRYSVSAGLEGFKTAVAPEVELRIGDRRRVDLVLSPGAITETVDVIGAAPLLETDISSRGQVIQGLQIRELPLNKRDYTQLALLAPGTSREPNHRLGGAMNINGNRALQNNFMLDGADNNSNATSYRGERVDVVRPSVDAVSEFRLMTNAYSAEFGRSAGAVVNVSIKSGSNEFHGGAWEFFRNEKLDAHGWTPTNPPDLKRKLRFNLFGANIGGPIVKDKAFFFVNYEGERERNGQTFIGSVATPELQAGNFNNVHSRASVALRNTPLDPTNRQPFPGLIIPRSRWDPVTARILADPNYPKPTVGGGIIGNNFNTTKTDVTRSDKFDIRIDQNFSSRWRMFGRYSFSDLERFSPARFNGFAEGSTNDAFGTTATRGQSAIMGPTITISPTTLGEIRVGYTRLGANVFPVNFGSPPVRELLGIPNLPDAPNINGGWPKIQVEGIDAVGRHTSTPQFQIPNVYLYKATFTFLRGAHSIKAGTDNMHIYTAIMDVSATIGNFSFNRGVFTNNSFADFLLGLPRNISLTSPSVIYNQKRINAFFLQDDFRVLPTLTLNLGLRYEYGQPLTEKFNRVANFNQATGERLFGKSGDIASRALTVPDRNDFSPRVGLAWTARPGFVVRSAYGIFYNHTNRQGREGLLGMNNPFVKDLTRRQTASTANPIRFSTGPPPNFLDTASPTDQINRGNEFSLRNPYIQQWNLTLQFQPRQNWLLEVGYIGNRGNKLTRFYDANQALAPGPPDPLSQRRPYPNFGDIQFMDSGGTSNYHALQTRLERRWFDGFSFLHSFTYGRALENVGAWGEEQSGGGRRPQNAYDFASEYGLAGTGSKFRSVANWVYELPFGRGRAMMTNAHPVINGIFGGWEASGIWTLQSGLPVNIRSNECGSRCQMGTDRRQRADVVLGQDWRLSNPAPAQWWNRAAFAEPRGPFGTASRNSVYGPGLHGWDLSVSKNFLFGENRRIQFRGEFFNLFNQVNFDRPSDNVSSSNFATVTTAQPGRSIQLGLKFYW